MQVKMWKKLCLDTSSAPSGGLPVDVWSHILSMLIDGALMDLSFVRDICSAGACLVICAR